MVTRAIVARPTENGGFAGRHVHVDGSPDAVVPLVHGFVRYIHRGNVETATRFLIDDHPFGWKRLPAPDGKGKCWCHDETWHDMGLLTNDNAPADIQYVYVLHPDRLAVLVDGDNGWAETSSSAWPPSPWVQTRVCIGETLGPYDARVDPTHRWNGWLSPFFTLDTARQLAARTQELADECGHDNVPHDPRHRRRHRQRRRAARGRRPHPVAVPRGEPVGRRGRRARHPGPVRHWRLRVDLALRVLVVLLRASQRLA
ncbi:hypothetical protein ACFV3E_40810 [Streptomyces sp. NPDC059718]